MKKILAFIVIVLALCCFTACNKTDSNTLDTAVENNSAASSEDTAAKESSTCEFSKVVMEIPGGFVSLNDSDVFTNYVTDKYPEVLDSISFSKSTETVDDYSEENLNLLMQQLNERAERSIYSDEGCIDYTQYTIDGHDAVSYKSEITGDDTVSLQTQVVVFFDDGAVIISLSDHSANYDEEFEKAVQSIRVNS